MSVVQSLCPNLGSSGSWNRHRNGKRDGPVTPSPCEAEQLLYYVCVKNMCVETPLFPSLTTIRGFPRRWGRFTRGSFGIRVRLHDVKEFVKTFENLSRVSNSVYETFRGTPHLVTENPTETRKPLLVIGNPRLGTLLSPSGPPLIRK